MDRQIIYPGQIPLDTDLLNTNKNAMVAIGKLAGAAFGNSPVVNGLAVTSGTGLTVSVAAGEIYITRNMDDTSYGSLAADTTNQVIKQGILLAGVTLSCPAPTTTGQSINYLIQAAFSEADTGSVALPYFNSSNPTQAWSGPSNSGTPQATARQDLCVVSAVAGPALATGTQTTPVPAANAVGLAVVTVAFGQTGITSANIAPYPGASLVPQSGLASNVAHAIYTKNVSGNTDVTLTAQEAAYPLLTLTGALTGNINVIVPAVSRQRVINNQTTGAGYNVTVKTLAGTGLSVPQGQTMSLYCDGVNVLNESSASLMPAYALATGTPDAITASYAVSTPTLYDGYYLTVGIAATNTTTQPSFAPTLNGVAQTARNIIKYIKNVPSVLAPGDLQGKAELRYDLSGLCWVLQNPGLAMSGQGVPYADATGTADAVTASYAVVNPTLSDGYQLTIGIASPNLTTTPTFAPTLNGVAQTAHTVVKYIGNVAVPLASGDMQGVAQLVYDLPNTRWVLQNPGADMSNQSLPYADATGTSDAVTASYTGVNPALSDGYQLTVGIAAVNATTAPTFAPTLNGIAQTAHTVVKYINNVGVPLAPGDLQGVAQLAYDLPNTRWVLQNPGLAMSGQGVPYADATGTADAVTASYAVVNPVLTDGYQLTVGIATPNTTTTPSFTPTLNGIAQTPCTIVKYINNVAVVLAPGDLQGVAQLVYIMPGQCWVLQNPASVAQPFAPTITATVAANALTIGASPFALSFRSSAYGSGAISTVSASPANMVIPAGATLGTANGVLSRLIILEVLSGGSAQLAVVNAAGGFNLDETLLISTTAISAAATASNIIYSNTALFGPFRVIGYVESTQTTAGTWATAPSTIQPAAGNALAGMSSIGYGQALQNITGSRAPGTTYYNTTGRPIYVAICMNSTSAATIIATVIGIPLLGSTSFAASATAFVSYIVPPGGAYSTTMNAGTPAINSWIELR